MWNDRESSEPNVRSGASFYHTESDENSSVDILIALLRKDPIMPGDTRLRDAATDQTDVNARELLYRECAEGHISVFGVFHDTPDAHNAPPA